ncbi:hypothetical protein ACJX0J_006068, partial [Zea mays]
AARCGYEGSVNEAIKMFNPMVHTGFIQNMWHVPAICFVAVDNELCFLQCLYMPAQMHLAVEEYLFGSFRGPRARRESSGAGCLCLRLGSGEARSASSNNWRPPFVPRQDHPRWHPREITRRLTRLRRQHCCPLAPHLQVTPWPANFRAGAYP